MLVVANIGPDGVSECEMGIESKGPGTISDSLLVFMLLVENIGPEGVCRSKFGIEPERLVAVGDSPIVIPFPDVAPSPPGEGEGELWVEADGLVTGGEGFVILALPEIHLAALEGGIAEKLERQQGDAHRHWSGPRGRGNTQARQYGQSPESEYSSRHPYTLLVPEPSSHDAAEQPTPQKVQHKPGGVYGTNTRTISLMTNARDNGLCPTPYRLGLRSFNRFNRFDADD
jgi:hypothetical protein